MKINCKNNIPIWNNPNWNIIRLRGNLYFSNLCCRSESMSSMVP